MYDIYFSMKVLIYHLCDASRSDGFRVQLQELVPPTYIHTYTNDFKTSNTHLFIYTYTNHASDSPLAQSHGERVLCYVQRVEVRLVLQLRQVGYQLRPAYINTYIHIFMVKVKVAFFRDLYIILYMYTYEKRSGREEAHCASFTYVGPSTSMQATTYAQSVSDLLSSSRGGATTRAEDITVLQ